MNFDCTSEQSDIREAVLANCAGFPNAYWRASDEDGLFAVEFHDAMARAGWLGIAVPEACGGSGLGVIEAVDMMQAVAEPGAGLSGCSSVHINIIGLLPVVQQGNDDQRHRILPPIARGEVKACFAMTESDDGLSTTKLMTRATRYFDCDVVQGQKAWIATAPVADKMLLLARATLLEELAVDDRAVGLSLFYTDLDRSRVDVRVIEKMGRKCVDSDELFVDGLEISLDDRIGEGGRCFRYIMHGMNPERILLAAEALGVGRIACTKEASAYDDGRLVFDRLIGRNQAIQRPLVESWIESPSADLLTMRAASLFDSGRDCRAQANATKYLAAEAGFRSCARAVPTHGGMGYSKELHVERHMREILSARIESVSRELIHSDLAERVLGLPKSY